MPTPHKTLQLDSKGRWGVRLDMEQPSGRPSNWSDVQAGAYLRVTPRLRVVGSVGFGDKFATPQRITPEDTAPPRASGDGVQVLSASTAATPANSIPTSLSTERASIPPRA